MSTAKKSLSQQTIVLTGGRELTRTVGDLTGNADVQHGTVILRGGASVDVRRDTRESLCWYDTSDEVRHV